MPTDSRPSATPVSGGWLGLQLVNAPADSSREGVRGAIVKSVAPGGPAANAGVLEGDVVVQYGRTPISDVATLIRLAAANGPGDSVPIRVRRGTTEQTLRVVVGDRAAAPARAAATVMIYYAADDDQKTAEDLATELRASINDPWYTIRTLKTSRFSSGEGEVRYSSSDLSTLAGVLARSAGSWLSKTYGRRVAVTPLVDPRVIATSVVVVMPRRTSVPAIPGRTSAPAATLPDPVVIVVYPTANEARSAEELADFLRTRRSGWKYSVRTVQKTTGPTGGQLEYDSERTGELARVLARDMGGWISRSYGRRVALEPTLNGRIGADAVVLTLPSR